jgi:hypothetical protein
MLRAPLPQRMELRRRRARMPVGGGLRHGLPERSTASLRAVLREGMTQTANASDDFVNRRPS